jgi:hypothetical protein
MDKPRFRLSIRRLMVVVAIVAAIIAFEQFLFARSVDLTGASTDIRKLPDALIEFAAINTVIVALLGRLAYAFRRKWSRVAANRITPL